MLCRVEMPMNEQIYGRFYRWKLFHKAGAVSPVSVLLLPVLLLFVAVFLLLMGSVLLWPLALAAVAVALVVYSLYLRPGMDFRRQPGVALQTQVLILTDAGFSWVVRSEEEGVVDSGSAQYDVVVKAVETSKDFYLLTGQTQGWLMDKEYFTKGSPEELRGLLQKSLGERFAAK